MSDTTKIMSKQKFYTLSWTYGIIMSVIGAIVIGCILFYGLITKKSYKLKKCGYCYYLAIGKNWGGLELGMFFLVDSKESNVTKWHEHGHGIQNCIWGPLFPFVIWIPSAIRYWYREIKYHKKGLTPPTNYDDIWFEGQASSLGRIYKTRLKSET